MAKLLEPDVVICGAGASGLFIARKLKEYGLEVILIELQETLACGPSTRNEGWLHAGTVHSATIDDEERAIPVARRVKFGHKQIFHFAPEAVEDPDSRSFILIPEESLDTTIRRWRQAEIYHRPVRYSEIGEEALNRDVALRNAIFEVSDVAINTRILYAKLYAELMLDVEHRFIGWEIEGFDDNLSTARVRRRNSAEVTFIKPKAFVYALGPHTGEFFRMKLGQNIPVRLYVSHLVDMPRVCQHGYFMIGGRDATLMPHRDWTIFGLSKEQRPIDAPIGDQFDVSDDIKDEILSAAVRLIPKAGDFLEQARVRRCMKVTSQLDNNQLPDLIAQFGMPVPGHIWALAGKMTEAPFVAARVFHEYLWNVLELGDIVSRRPIDEDSEVERVQAANR
jgi:glycerol-3-phosphate dehydrogenase